MSSAAALIFGFPRQVAGMRRAVLDFVSEAFGTSAFEQGVLLRGVYFTSGTQEGTPIDRMLGALARTFGLGVRAVSAPAGRGKAYFIQRLLMDVVFRESGLAGVNRRVELRQALVQATTYIGIAAVTILGVLAFALSYKGNSAYLADVQKGVKPLEAFQGAAATDLLAELPRLDAYHDALVAANEYRGDVPLSMRFGLYQEGRSWRGARCLRPRAQLRADSRDCGDAARTDGALGERARQVVRISEGLPDAGLARAPGSQ